MHIRSRISVLLMAGLLALPTVALSKEHGRGHSGKDSGGSFHSRGSGGGERSNSFRERISSFRERPSREQFRSRSTGLERSLQRAWAPSGGARERGWSRSSNGPVARERSWSRNSGERMFRQPGPGRIDRSGDLVRRVARGDAYRRYTPSDRGSAPRYRSDTRTPARYRDGGRTYASRDGGRAYTRYRDDGARYKPSGPIIQGGGGYRAHHYYTGGFYRPRYIARSGFSLGLTIASYPSYGYRYWDPYCGIYFSSLDPYYGHCHGIHPSAILVVDYRSHAPIATCIYDEGAWVVDDCCAYDDGYGYDDGYYDDGYDDDGYCSDEDY